MLGFGARCLMFGFWFGFGFGFGFFGLTNPKNTLTHTRVDHEAIELELVLRSSLA